MHLNSGLAQCATVRPLPGSPHPHPRALALDPRLILHWSREPGSHGDRVCLPPGYSPLSPSSQRREQLVFRGPRSDPGGCGWSRVGARGTLSGSQGCVLRHRPRQWVSLRPGPPDRELETLVPRRLSPYCGREGGSGPASPGGFDPPMAPSLRVRSGSNSPLCIGPTDDSPQLKTPAVALFWGCGVPP